MTAPRRVEGLEIRPGAETTLVAPPGADRVHVLNASAARVLARCDGAADAAALREALRDGADVPEATLEADLHAILAEFVRLGLVVEA